MVDPDCNDALCEVDGCVGCAAYRIHCDELEAALDKERHERALAQVEAIAGQHGVGHLGDLVDELRDRVAELEAALREALDGYDEGSRYKGDFLREKHGDEESIARLRKVLEQGGGDT